MPTAMRSRGQSTTGGFTTRSSFTRQAKTYTFNSLYNPLPESTKEKWYKHVEEGTGRRYNMADLTAAKPGGTRSSSGRGTRPPDGRYWAYSREKLEEMDKQGLIVC